MEFFFKNSVSKFFTFYDYFLVLTKTTEPRRSVSVTSTNPSTEPPTPLAHLIHLNQNSSEDQIHSQVSLQDYQSSMSLINPKTDKLVRRLTIAATITASYFLLTADYGPQPNALDPVSFSFFSFFSSFKATIFNHISCFL